MIGFTLAERTAWNTAESLGGLGTRRRPKEKEGV
jgi:hypothetical protein